MKTAKVFRIGMSEDPVKWRKNVRTVVALITASWVVIIAAILVVRALL